MADPTLHVSEDPLAFAASTLAEAIVRADTARGGARVAIPGGSAVQVIGATRARLPPAVWARVHLTWVDERCVPFAHADSNRGAAHRAGYLSEDAPPARELSLFDDQEEPEAAVARVAAAVAAELDGALDVTLLGMGGDGHIASLFPGRPEPDGLVAHVSDSPKPPANRITLTRRLLATAGTHVLYATGDDKQDAIARLLRGDSVLPAVGLAGLRIITDRAPPS